MLVSDEGTLQGLQKLFADAMPSLGLFSDEGGQWLGGFAMSEEQRGQTGAALSKLWDGAPIKRVRGTDGVTILRGRRLSIHLMIQHRIARRLFGDPDLKDQGLLSRLLICQPLSMKGDRAWKRPDENSDLELTKYQTRVLKMLSDPMPMDHETRELRPKVIALSPDAEPLFIAFHDAVEIELKPGGGFEEITGFAAKLPEHAVRLAAVMAYFEDREVASISARALSAGINPALGTFRSHVELLAAAEKADRMPSAENGFRNLYLNQRVNRFSPFISPRVWGDGNVIVDEEAFLQGSCSAASISPRPPTSAPSC